MIACSQTNQTKLNNATETAKIGEVTRKLLAEGRINEAKAAQIPRMPGECSQQVPFSMELKKSLYTTVTELGVSLKTANNRIVKCYTFYERNRVARLKLLNRS